jgi:hypothetical protein
MQCKSFRGESGGALAVSIRVALPDGRIIIRRDTASEEEEMEDAFRVDGRRLHRAALLTYEQFAATLSNLLHSFSRFFRQEAAAAPTSVEARPDSKAAERRIGPQAPEPGDPNHRKFHRPLSDPAMPARSLLTPSQRAKLRSESGIRQSEGRSAYVTYTVAPRSRS